MSAGLLGLAFCLGCRAKAPLGNVPSATPAHDTVSTHTRTVQRLAEGIYAIRHPDAPDAFPQGNTLVVIGKRAVLVVDSGYLPSAAREDIAEIQHWTALPVRYLVNTHWHYDHTLGNTAYRDAFPGVVIVAHRETQKQIRGYNPQWFAHYPERADRMRKLITTGHDARGTPVTPGERAELEHALAGVDPVGAEFQSIAHRDDLAPDLAFDHELTLDLGGRDVRLLYLGRGNTLGDAVVYVPDAKLVATGDLVDHPVPYILGGYPIEQIATLDALLELEATVYLPGHGDVLRGAAFIQQERALIARVVEAVDHAVHRVGNGSTKLDQVRAEVAAALDVAALAAPFTGSDQEARDFFADETFPGLVDAIFAELWPR